MDTRLHPRVGERTAKDQLQRRRRARPPPGTLDGMLFFIHPAIRLVIGGAALAAGVAVHKNLLILLGAVIVVTAAGQWLRRARGSRR